MGILFQSVASESERYISAWYARGQINLNPFDGFLAYHTCIKVPFDGFGKNENSLFV